MKLLSKLLSNLFVTMGVIMIIWFGMSYAEILFKHEKPNPNYSDKNIIVNIFEQATEYYGYEY